MADDQEAPPTAEELAHTAEVTAHIAPPAPKPVILPATDILANTQIFFTRIREQDGVHFHSQLGCHFEEIAEMCDELSPLTGPAQDLIEAARYAIHELAEHLKLCAKDGTMSVAILEENRVGFLDSICDQIVTGTGSAYCAKMDVLNGMHDVNVSNFSKFGDDGQPIYDENHKMVKGPNYVPADLSRYV